MSNRLLAAVRKTSGDVLTEITIAEGCVFRASVYGRPAASLPMLITVRLKPDTTETRRRRSNHFISTSSIAMRSGPSIIAARPLPHG